MRPKPPHASQKLIRRECPQCHQTKSFPSRNLFCSAKCSQAAQIQIKEKQQKESKETVEYSPDGSVKVELDGTQIHTKEQLFSYCKLDPAEYDVKLRVTAWSVGMKPPAFTEKMKTGLGNEWPAWQREKKNTKPIAVQLFSVRAELTPRKEVQFAKRELEALRQKAASFAPKYAPVVIKDLKKTGNILEISIVDHHFGALIWGRETLGPDYDLKIARDCYEEAFSVLLKRSGQYKFDKILYVVGHDQINADNRAGTTERGTQQNNDGRIQKVFEVSRDCSIWGIEQARLIAPQVDVYPVSGNHDPLSTWFLGDTLNSWFRNTSGVTVHNEPSFRKYIQHGIVMLMLTHGNTGKLDNYPGTMAAEQPKMWGETIWHEAHTGDKHHRHMIELHGATVRILPSLRPPCAWSAENHYVGSLRAAEAYVWNEQEGLLGTAVYSMLGNKKT